MATKKMMRTSTPRMMKTSTPRSTSALRQKQNLMEKKIQADFDKSRGSMMKTSTPLKKAAMKKVATKRK